VKRRGIALPAALAAVVVLGALAALSTVAARAAIQEAAALADEARSERDRWVLRVRLEALLSTVSQSELVARSLAIGGADSAVSATMLSWPWHRIAVVAAGTPTIVELGRAALVEYPWCEPVATGGAAAVAAGTVSNDVDSGCAAVVLQADTAMVDPFFAAVSAGVAGPAPPETLVVNTAGVAAGVWRASRVVELAPGADVAGLVIAPVVRVGSAVRVRGAIVARDTLVIASGSTVLGDRLEALRALMDHARITLVGRRGQLLPP
jgi:hypothetical protein